MLTSPTNATVPVWRHKPTTVPEWRHQTTLRSRVDAINPSQPPLTSHTHTSQSRYGVTSPSVAGMTSSIHQLPVWRHRSISCRYDVTDPSAAGMTSPFHQLSVGSPVSRSASVSSIWSRTWRAVSDKRCRGVPQYLFHLSSFMSEEFENVADPQALNTRTAGGLSHLRTAGGGGYLPLPPPRKLENKKGSDKR